MPNKEPYKMYPGKHSEVNPGNFKGSEVMKYGALKMHPMKFEDQKGTGPGITKADKIAVAQNGYNPKNFRNQLGKAVGLAKKADKAYRAEGDKNDPDYQNMMNPKSHHPMDFVSDAQRRAAFASGYKAKGK